jgi:hypothetical protein
VINYYDENHNPWGTELWDVAKGRLGGGGFIEYDGLTQRAG